VADRYLGGGTWLHCEMGVEQLRMRLGAGRQTIGAAGDKLTVHTRVRPLRETFSGVM
jgi:hypothetical protein